jgi:twitching motility protein
MDGQGLGMENTENLANGGDLVISSTTGMQNAMNLTPEQMAEEARRQAAEGVMIPAVSDGELKIENLLEECVNRNASDIHLQVGLPPMFRVDGALLPMGGVKPLTDENLMKLVFATLDEEQQKILMEKKEFDYSFAFGNLARFRGNAFHEKGNIAVAFRLIPNKIRSVSDLGLPPVIESFANFPRGLVLVTGPTGSGKSTTLAALVDKINREKAARILTIEDPIEFTHKSIRSIVAQREVNYDTLSFAAALRSALREDPDVVLIGEMRDMETIAAAITIAETGHLVLATLHTNSAAQAIDRIIDVFPAHQQPQIRAQLANILMGISAQRLMPAIGGGRVIATEILVSNSGIRSLIREGKTHQIDSAIQTGADQGMQTMDRTLVKLINNGLITYETAAEYAVDIEELDRMMGR